METNRLAGVRRAFRQWQANHGTGPGHHIPNKMREGALGLLDEYSFVEVAKALRLSTDTVRRWQRHRGMPKRRMKTLPKKVKFIEVKGAPSNVFGAGVTLEWVRADGSQMRLTGCREGSELRGLINEFLTSRGAR